MTGRMSLNKGKKAERDVAAYFTKNGIPLRRHQRTGDVGNHDEGDIVGPTFTIEVKNWAGDLTIGSAVTLLAKLEHQRRPDHLGLLVDRLDRIADPGQWACWLTVQGTRALLNGPSGESTEDLRPLPPALIRAARFQLSTVVALLRQRGWVTNLVDPFGP